MPLSVLRSMPLSVLRSMPLSVLRSMPLSVLRSMPLLDIHDALLMTSIIIYVCSGPFHVNVSLAARSI